MTTIEDKNIPSRRGQRLIQVQLIYSFVTMMKKNKTTKILDRILNPVGPGLPRKKYEYDHEKKRYPTHFKRGLPQGIPRNEIFAKRFISSSVSIKQTSFRGTTTG